MTAEVNLGGHPAWNAVKMVVILSVISAVVAGGDFLMHDKLTLVGLLAELLWYFMGAFFLLRAILYSITSGVYKKAKRLVDDGKLIVSYIGRKAVACHGMAVVDEQNRRLYLNGHLYEFADVKSIQSGWEKKNNSQDHYVEIVVKHGAVPVQKVWFDNDQAATNFSHRLGNSLGFA